MLGRGQEQVNADGRLPFVRHFSQRYTAEPRLKVPDLLGGVSKQQVARFMQRATQMQRLGGVSIVLLFQVP